MTSCAEQQQTLDTAADFIYLNCNPTLPKKKNKSSRKEKDLLFRPSLPLRQLRCLLAYFITLSSKTTLSYGRIRTAALPLGRMFVFVPGRPRCSGAPRAARALPACRDAGAARSSPGTVRAAALPPSLAPIRPQDAHPDSHGKHGVLRLAIPHQPEHASLARGRPLRRGEGGERSRG